MNRIEWSRRALLAGVLGLALAPIPDARADETGRLTTHVLDTANGKPAAGMGIDFYRREGETYALVASMKTNKDGRTDKPLMVGEAFKTGSYQIVFHVAEYYRGLGTPLAEPAFLDTVPVQFSIADGKAHYHVPLLTTPWSYATYRGS
ncbi:hydroxyisourate hydrolase [Methylobacterium sp.]|jgi:5-hydroxyisourate hydrolase|uniref:hydroxyisourate hydrolase n=1 Tax=Methylobacterium sp. TaxID=409 RepID=UPI0026214053|nr:hydroxyisourate hydrolase [Methylobacterium sp.]MDB5646958.1 uraH [Methylobacterium sp.]